MKNLLIYACFSVSLIGCAGIESAFINNPAAGTYSGTFTSTNGDSGTASLQLTKLGNVFGTLNNQTTGKKGSLTGSVDKDLVLNGTLSYPGMATVNVSGKFQADHGIVTGDLKSAAYTDTFHLTKQ
ncbi:MAG TPA: hypothetical protein VG944_20400 [Fimbriimonas sp.]|nr:hypothetical protein [Fimbriimonas sp.]